MLRITNKLEQTFKDIQNMQREGYFLSSREVALGTVVLTGVVTCAFAVWEYNLGIIFNVDRVDIDDPLRFLEYAVIVSWISFWIALPLFVACGICHAMIMVLLRLMLHGKELLNRE